MSLLSPDQRIPRRNVCCSKGEESLWRAERYYSVLERPNGRLFLRHDFCRRCWERVQPETDFPHWVAMWEVKRESKEGDKRNFREQGRRILDRLRDFLAEGEPEGLERAFFLALYLHRHKFLLLRKEDDREWLFEVVEEGEILAIPPIPLSMEKISRYQALAGSEI